MSSTYNIYGSAKLGAYGELVSGYDDIAQSIGVILSTQRGSVPLEPLYGVDHLKYIDKPLEQIRGPYTADMVEALTLWEPRATVQGVSFGRDGAELSITVRWSPKDANIVRADVFVVGV